MRSRSRSSPPDSATMPCAVKRRSTTRRSIRVRSSRAWTRPEIYVAADGDDLEASTQAVLDEYERVRRYGFTVDEVDRAVETLRSFVDTEYDGRDTRQDSDFAEEYVSLRAARRSDPDRRGGVRVRQRGARSGDAGDGRVRVRRAPRRRRGPDARGRARVGSRRRGAPTRCSSSRSSVSVSGRSSLATTTRRSTTR